MYIETIPLWEDRKDVTLTTFLSQDAPFIAEKFPKKRPAVIVCPGGGYRRCPRHDNEGDPVAMAFAIDGYQTFVLEYSVADFAPIEKTLFPAQLRDLGKAMLTVRDHAQEWGIDTEKISVIGFSAGGHLCGMLATSWHRPVLSEYFHRDPEEFKPLTAMLIYPVADYVEQEKFRKSRPDLRDNFDMNTHVFGKADPDLEAQKENSPAWLVSEYTVPVFIAAAQNDGLVTAKNSLSLALRLQEQGIPYELHMFELGDHGFGLGNNIYEPYRQDRAHASRAWLPLAKTFLLHHIAPETAEDEKNPFEDPENFLK